MDRLRKDLFRTLLSDSWSHGVEPAIDLALLGRYYERIGDHAVSMARRVVYLVTGELSLSSFRRLSAARSSRPRRQYISERVTTGASIVTSPARSNANVHGDVVAGRQRPPREHDRGFRAGVEGVAGADDRRPDLTLDVGRRPRCVADAASSFWVRSEVLTMTADNVAVPSPLSTASALYSCTSTGAEIGADAGLVLLVGLGIHAGAAASGERDHSRGEEGRGRRTQPRGACRSHRIPASVVGVARCYRAVSGGRVLTCSYTIVGTDPTNLASLPRVILVT